MIELVPIADVFKQWGKPLPPELQNLVIDVEARVIPDPEPEPIPEPPEPTEYEKTVAALKALAESDTPPPNFLGVPK